MARPLDHDKRDELLAGVVRYIGKRGLTDLSLRPLAAELGTSSRMLIYYFGTKEELLVQAWKTQRPDISASFEGVVDFEGLGWRLRELWQSLTHGETATSMRVLFQVMGAACMEQQGPFADYVISAIKSLVSELGDVIVRLGWRHADASVAATVLVSGLRGILLDRLITGDIDRTDRAAWLLIDQTAIPSRR